MQIKSTPYLLEFYKEYGDWLDRGAPDGGFRKNRGLCSNVVLWCYNNNNDRFAQPMIKEMAEQFIAAGMDGECPFNKNYEYYHEESFLRAMAHLNDDRRKWVYARIADGEIE